MDNVQDQHTLLRLLARLRETNNVQVQLNDSDRMIGFRLGVQNVIGQIEQLTKQED